MPETPRKGRMSLPRRSPRSGAHFSFPLYKHNILGHLGKNSPTGSMMPDDPTIAFDRPDAADIEIIRAPSGRIIHAKVKDNSVLAYLLAIHLADHGHEAAANTYLDWQLAYLSRCGFRIGDYGLTHEGGGDDTKASMYLKLISMLGFHGQKMVEHCLEPQNRMMEMLLHRLKRDGFDRGTDTATQLEQIGQRYIGFIDKLCRTIPIVRKEFDVDVKKVVAKPNESR